MNFFTKQKQTPRNRKKKKTSLLQKDKVRQWEEQFMKFGLTNTVYIHNTESTRTNSIAFGALYSIDCKKQSRKIIKRMLDKCITESGGCIPQTKRAVKINAIAEFNKT